jgi:glucokinase
MILAGDVGGTKTRLALFSIEEGPHKPTGETTYPSSRYASLEVIAKEFLAKSKKSVELAIFGVAGPVVSGQATVTNLPWRIDEDLLSQSLGIQSVHLLNDLEAIAYAIPFLTTADVNTLNEGRPDPEGSIAIVAPGTGLGEAYLTWDGHHYRAFASEGGHTDFAPVNDLQIGLLRYLQERGMHVSYERVCSGKGVPNIYDYLRDKDYAAEPVWLSDKLAVAEDRTPVIFNAALDLEKPCELCWSTLKIFVSILGAEAGNFALKILADGGVYLAGGIPPRILPALTQGQFMAAFLNKGRLSTILDKMPIHVIVNPNVAILGSACYGFDIVLNHA